MGVSCSTTTTQSQDALIGAASDHRGIDIDVLSQVDRNKWPETVEQWALIERIEYTEYVAKRRKAAVMQRIAHDELPYFTPLPPPSVIRETSAVLHPHDPNLAVMRVIMFGN